MVFRTANCGRLIRTGDEYAISPGLTLFSCNDLPHRADPRGLTRLEDGVFAPEDFRHEQYLLIEEDGRRILFSGCSHRGIENIAAHFRPDILIGGFHFSGLALDDARLLSAAETLKDIGCTCYTGHCTGEKQFEVMKQIMGDQLHYLHAGTVLHI